MPSSVLLPLCMNHSAEPIVFHFVFVQEFYYQCYLYQTG